MRCAARAGFTLCIAPQVCFDLPTTLLAFIQSRGRARVLDSHMVLMLEAGNEVQAQLVTEVKTCVREPRTVTLRTRTGCKAIHVLMPPVGSCDLLHEEKLALSRSVMYNLQRCMSAGMRTRCEQKGCGG